MADRRKTLAETLCQIELSTKHGNKMLAFSMRAAYALHMPKKKASEQVATNEQIERSIHVIRGQRVMLDSDLAQLYGVTTKQLNQQVSRNKERFPDDFSYQLTLQEFRNLKSQIVTSSPRTPLP